MPYNPPEITHVVKKYDKRVHGYMMSTLSSNMKNIKKDKREIDNSNEKLKQKLKLEEQSISKEESKIEMESKHSYTKATFSAKQKSREGTPTKTVRDSTPTKAVRDGTPTKTARDRTPTKISKNEEKKASSVHLTPKKKSRRKTIDSNKTVQAEKLIIKEDITKIYKGEVFRIDSPKPSPSPTKLRRTIVSEHIKKLSHSTDRPSFDKTVQFADRARSQSVIPTTYYELIEEGRKSASPTSLPGSPIRVRSANGCTKQLTSEVFTRTQNYTGSIEVIYRQPYENIRKVASALKNETEMSLIDTTDSSLSESVALPSSPSDHDVSSDANGRFKSLSPTSPKARRSLESIHESCHRMSDLILCADIREDRMIQETELPRKLVMSQYGELKQESTNREYTIHKSEERLSPILDVQVISPSRRQFQYEYLEGSTSKGNTSSVLPDSKAVSSQSMASRIDTSKEV